MDGLERKLDGKASVIRLDVMSQVGRQAAARFGVRGVPTLILVDSEGEVTLRQVGIIRPGGVRSRVDDIISNGRRE